MPRVPVKLTRGEIVLPPSVARQYRQRLEEMNAMGLQARAAGGVVAYLQPGGEVPEQPTGTQKFLGQNVPTGAIGKLGQSLVSIGQRDFKGASDALAQPVSEAEDEETDSSAGTIKLAREAGALIQGAAQAADFINGHNQDLTEEEKTEVSDAEKGWLAQVSSTAGSLISTGLGAFSQTAKIREEALRKIAYRRYPESYREYTRLINVANKMVFPILESGALGVNPTDADVDLAKKATFDVTAPSTTWASQLNDLINREGGVGDIAAVLAQQTGNTDTVAQVSDGKTKVNTSNVNTETPAETPAETPEEPEGEKNPYATTFDSALPGLRGNWAEISEDKVPEDVKAIGEKNRTIISDDNYVFVLHDAGVFFEARWYVREDKHNG